MREGERIKTTSRVFIAKYIGGNNISQKTVFNLFPSGSAVAANTATLPSVG